MCASRCVRAERMLPLLLPLLLALAAGCDDVTGPSTGAIRVSLTTVGTDIDPDGYVVSVDGRPTGSVQANGSVRISRIQPGLRTVRLERLAENCSADGTERVVTVVAGSEAAAAFAVSCAARVGTLQLTTVTSGDEPDPDGYTVELAEIVRGVLGEFSPSQQIGVSATVTLPGTRAGDYALRLSGLAPNCAVTPPTSVVRVASGATTEVTFAVQCVATGALQATAVTSGPDPDPDGYTLQIASADIGSDVGTSAGLPTGGAVATRLPPDDYDVTLAGVAENCAVAGGTKRQVEVAAGATAVVAFDVACAPATRLAFVRDGQIHLVNSNGTGLVRLTSDGENKDPAWSPDGQRIVFASMRGGRWDVYVMNADGSNVVRLTSVGSDNTQPAWSPDGRRIAFASTRDGSRDIYVMSATADGSAPVRLTGDPGADTDPAWSPDGGRIAFTSTRGGGADVYVMNADGSGVTRLTGGGSGDVYSRPAWSPDGRRIAVVQSYCDYYCYYYYGDDADRAYTVRVMNPDGSGATSLAPAAAPDDAAPAWSPDGRTLAYAAQLCDDRRCPRSVVYARADGSYSDLIVPDGYSPSWRR